MNLRILKTFVTVAEFKNFRKAAELLQFSQPAISVQIKTLEDELGTRLFDRSSTGIELTEKGRLFLNYARNILLEWNEAAEIINHTGGLSGTIRIGCPESVAMSVLKKSVIEFCEENQDVHVKIRTSSLQQMTDLLCNNELDFAYILNKPFFYPQWNRLLEKEEPIVFVCSPENACYKKGITGCRDLEQCRFILTDSWNTTSYTNELLSSLMHMDVHLNIIIEMSSTSLIKDYIIGSEYMGFLPYFVVKNEVLSGKLAAFEVPEISISVMHQIFAMKKKWISPAGSAFIRKIESELSGV